ncbi:MAG: PspC domain-containing protein [Actinomyces sp.]|jgi:phage shock protein C|uniref:PspC domain-containing protein n=1 Tax=Schaalia naturae TaxID=635203 RepID=A0ABW2SQF2_9ACTO|nr:PspC domain-containing protein [Actinomyces sp.]MCI1787853.1 PspC domain-containing protein [Actinomyces sp.]MCI1829811.1 PspC domain-containing protein [Actinomyces sp.]MCI1866994.1 PspC domain-containing protein [Actinomyces sp.]
MALTRSSTDKILGGVCGGIARSSGLTPATVRLLTVLVGLTPVPVIPIYLVLWLALPAE